ncbi:hypothetical protein ABT158_29555 [Nonomuraea sp. NPDC001636]|uniref:hypothetical protein n=1 Tax=Nonomuraea sp. NPDC001636 TaxID=3154391 RepID=UPI003321B94F
MSPKAMAFVALLLIGSGILTGLMSVTSGGESCGSAFVGVAWTQFDPSSAWADRLQRLENCTDLRSLVRIPATVLIAAGGVTLFAAFLSRRRISVSDG